MGSFVLRLQEVDHTQVALVGGKGAHLGELTRIEGVRVPPGFCVTTDAFRRIMREIPSIDAHLDRLSLLAPDEVEAIRTLGAEIRRRIEASVMPDDVAEAITTALSGPGEGAAYAVRSSATAEDSPTASFAGQHDTFLNVVGPAAVLEHVTRCWASLFTDRAMAYRLRNGMDPRAVLMGVVVQRMVHPHASGVVFTADPVTSNRKVLSIEATFGLGEALVDGRVHPDVFTVREGEIVAKAISGKAVRTVASPAGGTYEEAVPSTEQDRPALTDAQVVQLGELGRAIEAHLGCPQDIEWCLDDDGFRIVQSRPITPLFPIPAAGDAEVHVYVSVGHQQMMTDPIKPLGISVWQLTAFRPMYHAGGRLFVDVAKELASPASRAAVVANLGRSDPLIGDALQAVVDRDDIVPSSPDGGTGGPRSDPAPPIDTDPAIVTELIERGEASLEALERDIQGRSGEALLDFILQDIDELKRLLREPPTQQVVMGGIEAAWWLDEHLQRWLGEHSTADVLSQSVPDNVTSEMGLALLDVADAIRPHPEVVAFLRDVDGDDFLDELGELPGGAEARDAIRGYLDRYGMRGVGEIDITRPRWSERPSALVPAILGNVRQFEPGESARRFERGRRAAADGERVVLERLRALPDGAEKAEQAKRMIDRLRTFIGYREHPKYVIVNRYFVYKQALLREADRLVAHDVLRDREDIFSLTFDELRDVVRTGHVDDELIARRKDDHEAHRALTPPRVLTSDGEVISGTYRRDDVPPGALVGVAVSAGTVEGRARVVLDPADADLEPGDILVTPGTDPSWSPLFVAAAGLVTEVGGLMTHGAVIAREYGLPAVVCVERATELIQDGQRVRVHGAEGFVEIVPDAT